MVPARGQSGHEPEQQVDACGLEGQAQQGRQVLQIRNRNRNHSGKPEPEQTGPFDALLGSRAVRKSRRSGRIGVGAIKLFSRY
jgi:hypothetical protein